MIAACANERQQKRVYDILKRNRVKCRVSTLL